MKIQIGFLMLVILTASGCQKDQPTPSREALTQTEAIRANSVELNASGIDSLVQRIGDAQLALLGESSHGTQEFYEWRAQISSRLIDDNGFTAIAVEGDWPAIYELNRYVKGEMPEAQSAEQVLKRFNRWPTWMWANQEIASFAEWIRERNMTLPADKKIAFYGIDVYSLWQSLQEVQAFLETVDPSSASAASAAIHCFAAFESRDEFAYAEEKIRGKADCADELQTMLVTVQAKAKELNNEAAFNAVQNARVALNAERYYVTALQSNSASWNLRDEHMAETVDNIIAHHGVGSKVIIWAHNTHVGDARATEMKDEGMVNIGQLLREKYTNDNVHITGFGTYSGEVIAASSWGNQTQSMNVPAARSGSWEHLLHQVQPIDKIVFVNELKRHTGLMESIGHRAIGVIYAPDNEQGNYVNSIIPERYDAFVFIDKTHALHPLVTGFGRAARLKSFGFID